MEALLVKLGVNAGRDHKTQPIKNLFLSLSLIRIFTTETLKLLIWLLRFLNPHC